MKSTFFYFYIFLSLICVAFSDKESIRTKRQTYNYFYGSSDSQGDVYYVNDCGYLNSYQDSPYSGAYENESFIAYNSFPVIVKEIPITEEELSEVYELAFQLLQPECATEDTLKTLGIATTPEYCPIDSSGPSLRNATQQDNALEIVYQILAMRYKVNRFDVIKFTTSDIEGVLSAICPSKAFLDETELDRILPPHCVLEDSKLLNRLPSPRSLSLFLEQYKKKYNDYGVNYKSCLSSFGYFFFQAASHDIQHLQSRTPCGACLDITGCSNDGKTALTSSLTSNSIDTLDICSADPFYGFYGTTCVTSPKIQILNSDCEIRKRAPLNLASRFIDLSHIYKNAKVGKRGICNVVDTGFLPYLNDQRAYQTTPLLAIHILIALSHNTLAPIIAEADSSLSDTQVFDKAKEWNIYIMQKVLYNHLLPVVLGPDATKDHGIDATESCYDPNNQVFVDVESIVVALRYCHAYIPEEYWFLTENYEYFDRKPLKEKLTSEEFQTFLPYVLRGLFGTKVIKDEKDCNGCKPAEGYKDDLRALDIQVARDVCVEPYLQYLKKFYNTSANEGWKEYESFFKRDILKGLSYAYKLPQEMELAVAGAVENRHQSLFGNLFKLLISNLFSNLKCSDPNFWSNALTGAKKDFFLNFDVQDWLACIAGLEKRPEDLFCLNSTKPTLVPVTCASKDALIAAAPTLFNPCLASDGINLGVCY